MSTIKIETLARYYELLRNSNRLDDMLDFPALDLYSENKFKEYIKLTKQEVHQNNLEEDFHNLFKKYNTHKDIEDLVKGYHVETPNYITEEYRPFLLWSITFMVKLYLLRPRYTNDLQYDGKSINFKKKKSVFGDEEAENQLNLKDYYFRGISNAKFDLVPSIFRNLKNNEIYNLEKLIYLYENNGLKNKYKNVYKKVNLKSNKSIIDFFSYMQHSVSYSPFLDLTDSIIIASVFANHFTMNFNDYSNNDSAIYLIPKKLMNNGKFNFKEDYSVQVIGDKLKITDLIFRKHLWNVSLDDLKTKFYHINRKTNDRMKYQHGSFMVPYHAVIINGHMVMDTDSNKFIKIVIDKSKKLGLYNSVINKHPYLDYDYLMDPYIYFGVIK